MPDNLNAKILLVGSGIMAQEYAKVLNDLNIDYDVVGRGETSAKEFTFKTGKQVITGGLAEYFVTNNKQQYTHAIIATGVEYLSAISILILNNNIKNILIEKPGGINIQQIESINILAKSKQASVLIGYNRRFYASVIHAKNIIENDGGVSSFHFEFTEWSHIIESLDKPQLIKNNWFLANSTHVIDLAFYLGGLPKEISAYTQDKLSWHPVSKYVGAGITENNALFSYHANWDAPGRWSVEILTSKHRLYLKPLEGLQIQEKGSVAVNPLPIQDSLDKKYKPGLFLQTQAFLKNEYNGLCTIDDQCNNMQWYNLINKHDSI